MVIVLVTTLDVGGSNMPWGNNDQEEIMPECTEQIESIYGMYFEYERKIYRECHRKLHWYDKD